MEKIHGFVSFNIPTPEPGIQHPAKPLEGEAACRSERPRGLDVATKPFHLATSLFQSQPYWQCPEITARLLQAVSCHQQDAFSSSTSRLKPRAIYSACRKSIRILISHVPGSC